MARDSLEERPELTELAAFVNALNDIAGFRSNAEWARAASYYEPNISLLRRGLGGADGVTLLRLIQAAADRAELTADQVAIRAAKASDRLAALEALMTESVDLTQEVLQLLREARPEADEGEQPRQKATEP